MYDGDQLNFTILVDNFLARGFEIYEPHYNIVGYGSPFETSGLMSMQSPANALIGEWLKTGDNSEDDKFWDVV